MNCVFTLIGLGKWHVNNGNGKPLTLQLHQNKTPCHIWDAIGLCKTTLRLVLVVVKWCLTHRVYMLFVHCLRIRDFCRLPGGYGIVK